MSVITEGQAQQYADSTKLAARARLHQEFSVSDEPWFPWIMSQLPIKFGDNVLDIGCGPGWFWEGSSSLIPAGVDLTLADQSSGMVTEAMDRCAALPFASVQAETASITELPFADDSFDIVIAMHMLYHVSDQLGAVRELSRVLKPGGTLAVTTNGLANLKELYALTTLMGSDPVDPAAIAFGYDRASDLLRQQFGNVTQNVHPASLRITDPELVFLSLTSYPPGDSASTEELDALRQAIGAAFEEGNGVLNVQKDTALFLSMKDP